jgi:hypothetical protein
MSNTFFAGQTDYIEKLNVLALANDVANIPANAAAAESSANSAESSAATATTQATNASSSASSALSSKNSTQSLYTNFDKSYLGSKPSDPTLDNEGNALQVGALYFNTTTNGGLRAYNGSGWLSALAGTLVPQTFLGNGSTVSFTLPTDPAGKNNCQVFINGVYQQKPTYSVLGTTLTFSEAPPAPSSGTVNNIEVMVSSTLAITGSPTTTELASANGVNLVGNAVDNRILSVSPSTTAFSSYTARGTWVTGTLYSIKDVYVYQSIAYVVILSHTSSTVSSDLTSGKVAVHQGATRKELSSSGGAGLVGFGGINLVSDLREPDGSSLVGYIQDGFGAVARTAKKKMGESLSVTDFGAVGDYTVGGSGTDDSDAIQLALNACSITGVRELNIGAGTFLVTRTLTSQPVMLRGEVGATTIVFKNMAGTDGIVFSPSTEYGRVIGADGIEFVVEGQDMGHALRGPIASNQYFNFYLRYQFTNNFCRGANRVIEKHSFAWDFGATSWFTIGDCAGAEVSNNLIQGSFDIQQDPAGQLHDVGVSLDAAGAVLSLRMYGNSIGPIYQGLRVLNRAFMSVNSNDFIGNYDSITWEGTTLFNEPKIYNNNMNAQRYGINVDGPDSLAFTGNTIRRHRSGWKGATNDWFGYRIANCSDLKLRGNGVQPDEGGGVFAGTMYGYSVSLCALGNISDNFVGVGCDRGVLLQDCTGMTVSNTVTAQSDAADILFRLTNNTRATTIGPYELVSSFSGTVLSKESTIVGAIQMLNKDFDLQGTGNINFDITRVTGGVNSKKWRTTVGTTSATRAVVDDSGSGTNYELVTRVGSVVSQIEFRASVFKYNNGTTYTTSNASPEGIITAIPGSLHSRTSGGASTSFYVKESGSGNTGWVGK